MSPPPHISAGLVRYAAPSALLHDLRTPLNQIIGYSELLADQAQDEGLAGLQPDLQRIRLAGLKLLSLIGERFYTIPGTEPQPVPQVQVETDADGSLARPIPASTDGVGGRESVLVVDDNEDNRDVLSRRLTRQGYVVSTAGDGQAALEGLRAEPFDLVLLDIMMPVVDGYEVLRQLKADEHLQHVPIIMISALGEMDSVAKCIEMGAEDYLTKPFNPTLLSARIGACLGKKLAHDREVKLYEQLQEQYAKLQELENLRDNLTHMIIHDLRTPLASVIAGMQTLEMVGGLDDFQSEIVGISISGGETLLGMINDLLDVDKLESGTMEIDYSLLSVPELVTASIAQVTSLAQDKQLSIGKEISADMPALMGDEGKLVRLLVNLMGNAIKFTPSGGRITVSVCPSGDENSLRFSVTDTGEGIPAEAFGRIFEKFGQVESRKAGRTMSTGLGLTFCKLAAEAHGGSIGVESVTGEGSTFWFTIPLPSA